MKKFIIITLFFPCCLLAQDIPYRDSLKAKLNNNLTDSAKYVTYLIISDNYNYNDPDSAVYYAQQSIRFAMKHKENLPLWVDWNSYDVLGKALWNAGNFPNAQECFFKQVKQSEAINDTMGILRASNNLGGLNIEEGNYKEAIRYLRRGLPFYREREDKLMNSYFIELFDYLCRAYEKTNILDSAFHYAQMRLQLSMKSFGKQANVYSGILFGMIYSKMGQPLLALVHFRTYLNAVRNNPVQGKDIIDCYYEMSNHFERYQQTDSAIHYAMKSFGLSQKCKFKIDILDAARQLSRLYEFTGNIDSAFKYQTIMIATEEEMFSREKLSRMNMLVFNEQLRQKELEMEKQHQAELRSQRLQLSVLAIVIIVFIIAFLLLSRSFIVSQRFVRSLGIILLLITFEYIDQLLHPIIANLTNHTPVLMLLILVSVAALMVPLHYKLEKWTKYKLTEKNRLIRLSKAKKIIMETEESTDRKRTKQVLTE
ncbi:MAG: tetratricopeptide repeat protein [Bacteroidetes bacterium]|nr:tetratricopeptide repeat protein [Bacteroidota bacterium]